MDIYAQDWTSLIIEEALKEQLEQHQRDFMALFGPIADFLNQSYFDGPLRPMSKLKKAKAALKKAKQSPLFRKGE